MSQTVIKRLSPREGCNLNDDLEVWELSYQYPLPDNPDYRPNFQFPTFMDLARFAFDMRINITREMVDEAEGTA